MHFLDARRASQVTPYMTKKAVQGTKKPRVYRPNLYREGKEAEFWQKMQQLKAEETRNLPPAKVTLAELERDPQRAGELRHATQTDCRQDYIGTPWGHAFLVDPGEWVEVYQPGDKLLLVRINDLEGLGINWTCDGGNNGLMFVGPAPVAKLNAQAPMELARLQQQQVAFLAEVKATGMPPFAFQRHLRNQSYKAFRDPAYDHARDCSFCRGLRNRRQPRRADVKA